MSKDGGPAFPLQVTVASGMGGTIDLTDRHRLIYGMSLRDYFAAAALTGMTARGWSRYVDGDKRGVKEEIVELCYSTADAMLAERGK